VCKAAGADHLIDSETDDIRAAVKALGGADVVYDPVGGDQFSAALRAANPEARILVVGFASGEVPEVPANILLVKNIDVIGYYWGGYATFRPKVLADSLATLLGWYAAGRITPHVSHTIPLERAGDAYDLLRSRKSTGKVVVTTGPGERI
jgi:NADPH2:quinone reductase